MKFDYQARTKTGQIKQGEMEAESEQVLAEELNKQDLLLTKAKAVTPVDKKSWLTNLLSWQRISVVDKIFFTQNLQVMLKAGLTMVNGLLTLADQTTNKRFRAILKDIRQNIEKGQSLSEALAHHTNVFPEIFINMVRAGEKSGKLEEVLLHITNQMRKSHTLIAKLRGALTYPIVVLVAMIGIGITMIVFVLPQITAIFTEVDAVLPLPTRILIATSDIVQSSGLWILLGFILLVSLFIYLIHTNKGKKIWHSLLLKLPLAGPIFHKINLAKFARTFSSLLKTDIQIVQTFQITATTVSNVRYREALMLAADQVKKGTSVAQALGDNRQLFPPLVTQMAAVGEETGTLDSVLDDLAGFYEEEVDRVMNNLSTIIEPILIVLLGGAVGFFAVSIIMPIYSLTEQI